VSTAAIAANITLSLLLVRWLGFRGLALSTALVAVGNAAMLIWLLRRRLDGLGGRRLPVVFVKIVMAATVMAAAALAIQHVMNRVAPGIGLVPQIARLGTSIGGGLLTLGVMATFLRVAEFADAVGMVRARVRNLLGGRM
jgi:putative peptidoglycan lipid II flippase